MKHKNTNATRLGGFVLGQLVLSLVCYVVVIISLDVSAPYVSWSLNSTAGMVTAALVLMGLYFPTGVLLGGVAPWARVRTAKELGQSVLTQCAIAWGWAAVVLFALFVPGLLLSVFAPTIVLAFPSSVFVMVGLELCTDLGLGYLDAGFLGIIPLAFLAGLLPPVLYNLGNFLMGRTMGPQAEAMLPSAPDGSTPQTQKTDG